MFSRICSISDTFLLIIFLSNVIKFQTFYDLLFFELITNIHIFYFDILYSILLILKNLFKFISFLDEDRFRTKDVIFVLFSQTFILHFILNIEAVLNIS